MTPSKPKSDSAGLPVQASVADALKTIDTTVLDELLDLRKEEVRIEEFRLRADKMKGAVDPLVWQRVSDDYRSRLATLSSQAGPLKGRARLEYAKLRSVQDRLTIERRAAEIEKAELELRHAVGELGDDDLATRLTGSIEILSRCDVDEKSVGDLRTRFIEAFGTEAALEAVADVSPDATNMIPAEVVKAATTPQVITTAALPTPPPPPPPAPAPAPAPAAEAEDVSPDATILATPASAPPPAASAGDEQTFLLPAAALLVNPSEPSSQEYRLAAINYLGRSDDNHLQIARPGVSRRHAVISAANNGFTIQDLSSQNGVFVNGARITEHALKDGEQIVIGDSTMLFRTPWPVQGRRDAKTRATKP